MARFTVSDCMEKIPNRYELTLSAAIRARQLANNENTFVGEIKNDKPPVLALREIAENKVTREILKNVE